MKNLRRTITPYVGQTLILAGITVFMVYAGHMKSDRSAEWAPTILWALYGTYVGFFGLKYRVLWDETGVVMRASGLAERRVEYDQITDIRYELADSSEFLAQSRPFRRIVIHGKKHNPKAFIDVSVRHFRFDDIEELLAVIRRHRPDLHVPHLLVKGRLQSIREFNQQAK